MTTAQEERREHLIARYRVGQEMRIKDIAHDLVEHVRDDGSVIFELISPYQRGLPVHLERVLADGTVIEDEFIRLLS